MKGDGAKSSAEAPAMLTNEIVVQSMSSFNSTNFFSKKINQEKLLQKPYYLGGAKYTLIKKMPIYQSDASMADNAEEQMKVVKYTTNNQERSISSANIKRQHGPQGRGFYKQTNQSVPDFVTFTTSAKSRVSHEGGLQNKATFLRTSQHMNINADSEGKHMKHHENDISERIAN